MPSRQRKPKKKKKYYKPPPILDKFRGRLVNGTPTHTLLHYLHGRDKLPEDILAMAEAAEKLHQVRDLLSEVHDQGGIGRVEELTGCDVDALKSFISGGDNMIKSFMTNARKALVMKTMKEPEEG